MVRRDHLVGAFFMAMFIGCAGFSYQYYGLDVADYDHGTLLGPQAKDDLPFSVCKPTDANKHPCIVMMSGRFFAMKQDFEDTQQKLSDCQRAVTNASKAFE